MSHHATAASSKTGTPMGAPVFGLRCVAAIVDFVVLAIPVAVIVSFYSLFHKNPNDFLNLQPGESPAEVSQKFGVGFLTALVCGYIVANWLYFALAESSTHQATLGKRMCGLYVVDQNHHKPTFARASTRYFTGRPWLHVPLIGWFYVLVDCAFAAIAPKHQALHDRLSSCLVLKKSNQ
jgi:uncharacterized RDD family membrane protein YckC